MLSRGEHWVAPEDQVVSPTYVPDLVSTALDLLMDGERGLWHLATAVPELAEFARRRPALPTCTRCRGPPRP